ncbi:MAG: hypothetical protein PHI98_12850 [Eubacteriales bacterium]|nr:hypothetical protein [Eubacteriales bacterium]
MSMETQKKRRRLTAFGWLMIFLVALLILGLAVLLCGLALPQPPQQYLL